MRDYEILFIVRPELDEEQLGEAVKTVDRLIANLGGVSQRTDIWGKRRLAYEVDRLREGHYVLTDFRIEPARLNEMEATLKISETVFRHLIVRKPDGATPVLTIAQPETEPEAEIPQATPAAAAVEASAPAADAEIHPDGEEPGQEPGEERET